MRSAAGVSPHRNPGDRLRRHPAGVASLGLGIHLGAAEGHRHGGDQPAVEALERRPIAFTLASMRLPSSGLRDSVAFALNRGALLWSKVEQIELGHAVLRQPQRLAGAEHEAIDPHGAKQRLQMILRRAPDPADVPQDPAGLLRCGAEVDLLDERPVGVGDDEADSGVASDQCPHRPRRELARTIVGVPLPGILQPHRQHQRQTFRPTRLDEAPHLGTGWIEPIVGRVATDGGHSLRPRLGEDGFPSVQTGMDRRHRPEPVVPSGGLVQPGVPRGRIAPEDAW